MTGVSELLHSLVLSCVPLTLELLLALYLSFDARHGLILAIQLVLLVLGNIGLGRPLFDQRRLLFARTRCGELLLLFQSDP